MTTTQPTCTSCGQAILLHPDVRTVCAGCERRGGPPPAVDEQATGSTEQATSSTPVVAGGMPEGLTCSRDDCTRPILNMEDPDWDEPPTLSRAERAAAGLRVECWMHHRETHGLVGEYVFYPGRGVQPAV